MDYSKLGLRVGLEIHQQLSSDTKLFCRCPIKKSEEFPHVIARKLRPVAGELGEIDRAALYEFLRNRNFAYRFNTESSCLVELDDDPPKSMNESALQTALQICRLLNCDIADEIHVMRKTVIDGSSVSGFQRTVLVGMDGFVETSSGKVGIDTICIEEDSAPAVKKDGGTVEYRLDRALVPLVEIATAPDISSPQQAKEAAEKIGLLLRSTDVVRGIGSIRQDVNISIENGARVEIKGFQELGKISQLVENEAARQTALLEIRDELKKRGVKEIKAKIEDVAGIFSGTKNSLLRKIISEKGKIVAASLPFSGLMKKQCGHHTFGKELSSYAAAYGYGIMHSDEQNEQLSWEFSKIREKLKTKDLVFIVVGKDPRNAANAVIERGRQCLLGVPEETRTADGTGSRYARPLPGKERMYPETDVPPIRVTEKMKSVHVPKTLLEKEQELKKILSDELAEQLVKSRELSQFEKFRKDYKIDPAIIAATLLSTVKDLRRRKFNTEAVTDEVLGGVFMLVEQKKISKDSIPQILEQVCKGRQLKDAAKSYELLPEKELRATIKGIVKGNPKKTESALMGLAMQQLRGKADGKLIIKILREEMK